MNSTPQFFAAAFSLAFVTAGARGHSGAPARDELSKLPVGSVTAGSQAAGLAAPGAVFVVKRVDASAYATVYTLEGVPDGGRIAIEIAGRDAQPVSLVAGSVLATTATSTGTVLATGKDAVAFIPNALGRALLQNKAVTP